MKRAFSIIVILSMLLPVSAGAMPAPSLTAGFAPSAVLSFKTTAPVIVQGVDGDDVVIPPATYRTTVAVASPHDEARLQALGVTILQVADGKAVVLANEDQLEALARLRFEPRDTDRFSDLLPAGVSAMATLSAAAVVGMASVDDDGDGLTNTQESWWCTDPMNPDSDGDGWRDGEEVALLKDWLGNLRAGPPASGKPFAGWPPQISGCRDDDQDSVPDLAERWELGLNMNRESTDRDKFDDGQELFGNTYCPGSGGYCGYGALPRNEDWGVIFAEMPSWVRAPGNHPLVAAFPVPEVDVVPSSSHMQAVTTVTTDHTISSGTERSYSTAKTEGTSTSVANTVTWNEWQEVSESLQQRQLSGLRVASPQFLNAQCWFGGWGNPERKRQCIEADKYRQAKRIAEEGCKFKTGGSWSLDAKIFGIGVGYQFGQTEYSSVLTDSRCVSALRKAHQVGSGQFNSEYPLPESEINSLNIHQNVTNRYEPITIDNRETNIVLNDGLDTENIAAGLEGLQFTYAQTGQLIADRLYEMSQILAAPVRTTTTTQGKSWGGSQTTTNTEYEEHTITNGEAFSSGESWGTATAVDSSHAADLWFTYQVRDTGTEYAREIAGLAFNIYIGDDPNPAITYFVSPDLGGDGKYHNFMPNEEHTYTSRRIPLTLEQMKAVDLGGPVRIVVEDFTYGIDELFYQDAANAGVLIAMEDGTDDGDEAIDTYLIPTWGDETVLDVLARYFPHTTDADGNLVAIWTPEYRADTPAWCVEPRRVGTTLWCKHALSTADWWNVYTSGLGDGSEGFQDTPAAPGSVALFRFNQDSDLDGYSDRSEARLGTDPLDPASFPRPELIAGVHAIRAGNQVTATLSLLNTGLYDAYGVEAVMIAPDDSVSITNNTVGGSGRVRAQKQVIVGSCIVLQSPLPPQWTQSGHARPAVGGYYTGNADRTYTFTVQCGNPAGCDVGAGAWSLAWSDGAGGSGALNFGSGYASPTLQNVGTLGVKVGLLSGKVYNGESFTVEARTPRDTFQYTVNREPYTEPVVIVSYNDPQGNHRFVTPVRPTTPTENLAAYSGQMLPDPGVEIVTTAPFTTGANTVNLVVNNPTDRTLTDAHLFLEFVNISGTVVAEIPVTVTLPPGPTVQPVTFDVSRFTPPYQANEDYIVMAFWTDYQGNILDTAARPLSSFQADPRPAFAMAAADEVWDFGTAARGALLRRTVAVGSVGFMDLLAYVGSVPGLAVSGTGSRRLPPGDVALYDLTLNTAELPEGPFERTLTIRTSDPDHPTRTITIRGTITAYTPDTPPGTVQRPLDWSATFASGTQGQWAEFTHTLGPDPQSLHPVKVYSQDYSTLWGVGKYSGLGTIAFTLGSELRLTAHEYRSWSPHIDARQGQMHVVWDDEYPNDAGWDVFYRGYNGTIWGAEARLTPETSPDPSSRWPRVAVDSVGNKHIVWIDSRGIDWEVYYSKITSSGSLVVDQKRLTDDDGKYEYWPDIDVDSTNNLHVVWRHKNENANENEIWYMKLDSNGNRVIGPQILFASPVESANMPKIEIGRGDRVNIVYDREVNGTSEVFHTILDSNGHILLPEKRISLSDGVESSYANLGIDTDGRIYIFWLEARSVLHYAVVDESGNIIIPDSPVPSSAFSAHWPSIAIDGNGTVYVVWGSGSSVFLKALKNSQWSPDWKINSASAGILFPEAAADPLLEGRIYVVWVDSRDGNDEIYFSEVAAGLTYPALVEQLESAPYTTARLNLPETFSGGRTYQVQYGRRLVFGGAGEQTTTLRVPAAGFITTTLDALISEVGSGSLTFRLDIGDDGSWDWEWTGTVDNATTLTNSNLAAAFSRYWASHGAPTSGTVDVPVRVSLSKAGQVLLTNLQMNPTGSKMRYVHLVAQTYATATVSLLVNNDAPNPGPLTVAADVGDDGTVDWTWSGTPAYPVRLTTGNLAAAVNAYLSGRSGEVDVPIRFYVAPFLPLGLADFSATSSARPDAALSASDIAFGASSLTEGETVPITATLRNNSGLDTGGLTAAFYAAAPGWGEWYIGSAFVSGVPAGGTAQATIPWNTLGFTGTVPVRVVVDPYNRIAETNEDNNQATASLTVRTRPDLQVTQIALSDAEPTAGETVTVTLTLRNHGQTTAGAQTVGLYQGNPDAGGTVIGTANRPPVSGSGTDTFSFTWTPTAPGPYRLFSRVDQDNAVNEYDEGNNETWRDLYVGLASPVLLDSGGASDAAYSAALGYGYVDEGQTDQVGALCGTEPEQTMRKDPDGRVVYRFDHLLPGHFYHLDLVLMECDNIGRQESVYVDGNQVAGPIDLGDEAKHQLSLRLDPAVYADHVISVTVEAPGLNGAVVSEVSLHDIDYRYCDSGATNEPAYTPAVGYGYLDGTRQAGVLPYQSARVDQSDNTLRYQFDGLKAGKKYSLHFTFWQASGSTAIQKVQVDGVDTGTSVSVAPGVVYSTTVGVMPGYYETDGSIVVGVVRTNASTGAFVNEIALEEQTQEASYQCVVPATPNFTNAYGYVLLNGQSAPAGTIVQAFNPRGDVVGCYVVDTVGQYGFMPIYGEDTSVSPPIPGMRAGEMVAFRVNGAKAVATPSLYWEGDKASHRVDLDAGPTVGQTILLPPSQWSLMSFRVRPPVPLVQTVLASISGRYDRVLGETEVYDPGLPDVFNTLKEMHGGKGYYIHITSGATANLLVEGLSMPVTTPLSLHAGWNWAGYLPDVTLPVTVALQSIEGKYLIVTNGRQTFDPSLPEFSTLKQMKPGEGYLIRMTEAANLVYPASGGAQAMSEAEDVGLCTDALPTPYFTVLYGTLWVNGVPALPGTKVEMLTPRGEVAGCFVVQQGGRYGFVHVYGADGTGTPGFRQGEAVRFRVNGQEVVPSAPVLWSDDKMPHRADVGVPLRGAAPPVAPEVE